LISSFSKLVSQKLPWDFIIPRRRFKGWWLFCAFLFSAMLFISSAVTPAQYRFHNWNTDSGLPQNSIYDILQTRDGFLWFTTLDGLVRYDGASYTVFNKANSKGMKSNRLRCVYEDTDGSLWIGSEDGGVTHYQNNTFKTYTTDDGVPADLVAKVRRRPNGDLLVQTSNGVGRKEGERFVSITTDKSSPDNDLGILGPSGDEWYRVGSHLRRVKDGKATEYTIPPGGKETFITDQIYEDHQGRLWIGTWNDGELFTFKDGVTTRFGSEDGLPHSRFTSFFADHEGTMWFGSGGGLVCFRDGKFTTYTTTQGLPTNQIETIFEDREGTLWVGTYDDGITHLTRQVITTYSEADGMHGKIFYPIFEDKAENIWIGGQGVNRFKDGKFTFYPFNFAPQSQKGHEPTTAVWSIYQDREGNLWFGQAWGLCRFTDEKFVYDTQMSANWKTSAWPDAIYQDQSGAFWVGLGSALMRVKDGQRKWFDDKDGLTGMVQPIYEDRNGRIWIGSYNGLAQYVDGRLVFYTEKDGLSSNRIRSIYEDSDRVLWIGTYDGGLNRLKDGKFTRYTTKEGMFSNGVFAIVEDAHGNFWMSSNQGIYRARKQDLNDFANGKITNINTVSYGKADGMLNTECNGGRNPSALKAHDGRIWFPTSNGVAVVNPEAVSFNPVAPPVVIEKALLDRNDVDLQKPIELRPGQDDLEIDYAALSFIKPENVEFKYKLEPLDNDWTTAGYRRVTYYTHLPAGDYTFRVIAANSDGVWNNQGATLRIIVYPPFYRTWWFIGLSMAAVIGFAAIGYNYRVRQLDRARIAQETFSRQLLASQEGERRRIAGELHDSLGQNLLIIKNRALFSLTTPADHDRAIEQLTEISDSASQAIDEVREIAYNLRPYQLDRLGLTKAIQLLVSDASESLPIKFSVAIEPIDGIFSKEEEINLYRIIQECINNIIKHSKATEASVTITRDPDAIHVEVADNGCGFDKGQKAAESSTTTGFGLIGISERVRMLGGKHVIHSAPGEGTSIAIAIDIKG